VKIDDAFVDHFGASNMALRPPKRFCFHAKRQSASVVLDRPVKQEGARFAWEWA
jgi:hypothetical protein